MDRSCTVAPVEFSVHPELRECAPREAAVAAICPQCLAVSPVDDGTEAAADTDFSRVSGTFPDGEAGVALALVLGLLDSLATNRNCIETTLRHAERRGVDPLVELDRLLADPAVEPAIDLERRRHQVEQVLY